jgi:hypothetical protein
LIHGWNGGADTTWSKFPELLCQDEAFSDTEVFVVNYPTYLRFTSTGAPVAGCTLPTSQAGNAVESVLFDRSGDLYVATNYGHNPNHRPQKHQTL